ncbi:MAG: hypothetical protein EAZ84_10335 [Verrucomicrobia bacterium]|nr:MAG: hypothetical protein EAZ84_10335 [Verrucomicrobiota bacterium]
MIRDGIQKFRQIGSIDTKQWILPRPPDLAIFEPLTKPLKRGESRRLQARGGACFKDLRGCTSDAASGTWGGFNVETETLDSKTATA